ncbi:MAG TPA: hypothetical protein ENJ41_01905 [Oceanospirillales bacterium]|nr:hypothetical protein [Oceanospirillales bacterium]
MNNKLLISLSVAALSLSACGSNSARRQGSMPKEIFVTYIKPNGSKVFNYSLIKRMPSQGQMGKGMGKGMHGGMGGMKGGKKPDMNKMKAQMQAKATKKLGLKLAESGYCREGYMELDSFFERGHVTIKGECNDSATAQDREKFINSDD